MPEITRHPAPDEAEPLGGGTAAPTADAPLANAGYPDVGSSNPASVRFNSALSDFRSFAITG